MDRCKVTGRWLKGSSFDYVQGDITKCGIYKIENRCNKKYYIGQTGTSFSDRWNKHVWELQRKSHPNPILQNAFSKYGFHGFEFLVLEYIPSDDEQSRLQREQFYLDQKPDYNLNPLATGGSGFRITQETCNSIIDEFRSGKVKTVVGLSSKFGHTRTLIRSVLRGTHHFTKDMSDSDRSLHIQMLSSNVKAASVRTNRSNKKPVRHLETGDVYDCVSDAARALDVSPSTLRDAMRNRYKIKDSIMVEYVHQTPESNHRTPSATSSVQLTLF